LFEQEEYWDDRYAEQQNGISQQVVEQLIEKL